MMYCFENMAILIFFTYGLKLLDHAHFLELLGSSDTVNNVFVIETVKRHILLNPCRLRYRL